MPALTQEQEEFLANFDQSNPPGPPSGEQSGPPSVEQSGPPSGEQSGPPSGEQSGPPSGGQSGPPSGGQLGPPSGMYNPFSTCKGEGLHCARGIFDEMSSSNYKQVRFFCVCLMCTFIKILLR